MTKQQSVESGGRLTGRELLDSVASGVLEQAFPCTLRAAHALNEQTAKAGKQTKLMVIAMISDFTLSMLKAISLTTGNYGPALAAQVGHLTLGKIAEAAMEKQVAFDNSLKINGTN